MSRTKQQCKAEPPRRAITIVGGGATGSCASSLAARLQGVTHITLIDGDTYSEANLRSQNISPLDVGRPKVEVLAKRLRQQAPGIIVEPINSWVENVPRSKMRGEVVLSCLDSRRARCTVNEICWRLGVPLIDAGVDATGLLARTNIYWPGCARPCLVCGWNETDFAALEQVYACQQRSGGPPATNAPASLGSFAAGLLVSECERLLAGEFDPETDCRQVLWDLRHYKCLTTRYRVNPACRFDHECWDIEPLAVPPRSMSLGQLCELLGDTASTPKAIRLAGQRFVNRLVCGKCNAVRSVTPCLDRALTLNRLRCQGCGDRMVVSEFHAAEWLDISHKLPGRSARRSLSSVGFQLGDIVTVQQEVGRRYFELIDETLETGSGANRKRLEALTANVGRRVK